MKKIIGLLLIVSAALLSFTQARVLTLPNGTNYNTSYISNYKTSSRPARTIKANYFPSYSKAIVYQPYENYNSDHQTSAPKVKTVRLQYYTDYYGNQYIVARDY